MKVYLLSGALVHIYGFQSTQPVTKMIIRKERDW